LGAKFTLKWNFLSNEPLMIVHHTVFETLKQMKIVKPGGGETKRKKRKSETYLHIARQ
jgi:hypothetical protein